jgi:hypothetical protein
MSRNYRDEERNEEKRIITGPHQYDTHEFHEEKEKRCFSCTKNTKCLVLVISLLFLGGAIGALIGIFDLETVKSWFGLESEVADSGVIDVEGRQDSTIPYEFWQCPPEKTGDCCNGLESICDLHVNQVLFATVHNANHDNRTAFSNNLAPLEGALEAGYRGLMLDVCRCINDDGQEEITFCHGNCSFGPRDPTEVFTNINAFLNRNPSETLIINFELSVGNPTAPELWDVLQRVEGISSKTYIFRGGSWPTLRQLRTLNKQLILFKDRGHTCSSGSIDSLCVESIHEFHQYALETPFTFTSVEDVEDFSFSCSGDRGRDGSMDFYAINNFVANSLLGTPSKSASEMINEKRFLQQRLQDCEAITGLKANFINIDFWETGDVIQVTQEENQSRALLSRNV